jgi:tetratricopeptide (TPR) repeat protein
MQLLGCKEIKSKVLEFQDSVKILLDKINSVEVKMRSLEWLAFSAYRESPKKIRTVVECFSKLVDLSDSQMEKDRHTLRIADAYYLNGDNEMATNLYAQLFEKADSLPKDELLFRQVNSMIKSNAIEGVVALMESIGKNPNIIGTQGYWKSEWNLICSMVKGTKMAEALNRVRAILLHPLPTLSSQLKLKFSYVEAYISYRLNDFSTARQILESILSYDSLSTSSMEMYNLFASALLLAGKIDLCYGMYSSALYRFNGLRSHYGLSPCADNSFFYEAEYMAKCGNYEKASSILISFAENKLSYEAKLALYFSVQYDIENGLQDYDKSMATLEDIAKSETVLDLKYFARLAQGVVLRLRNDFPGAQLLYESMLEKISEGPLCNYLLFLKAKCMFVQSVKRRELVDQVSHILTRLVSTQSMDENFRIEIAAFQKFVYQSINDQKSAKDLIGSISSKYNTPGATDALNENGKYWLRRCVYDSGNMDT